jgi:predicted  nucleic acid-binding Zn-ribbon protein
MERDQPQSQETQQPTVIDAVQLLRQNGALNEAHQNLANRYNDLNNKYITQLENSLAACTKDREQVQRMLIEFSCDFNIYKKQSSEELSSLRRQIEQSQALAKSVSSLESSLANKFDNIAQSLLTLIKLFTSAFTKKTHETVL